MTSTQVKKISHNLVTLFVEARKRNIQNEVAFNSLEEGAIQVLNIDYSSKKLEYLDSCGTYYIPNIAVTEEVARKLVHGLSVKHS
jgi:hypothetical protein